MIILINDDWCQLRSLKMIAARRGSAKQQVSVAAFVVYIILYSSFTRYFMDLLLLSVETVNFMILQIIMFIQLTFKSIWEVLLTKQLYTKGRVLIRVPFGAWSPRVYTLTPPNFKRKARLIQMLYICTSTKGQNFQFLFTSGNLFRW